MMKGGMRAGKFFVVIVSVSGTGAITVGMNLLSTESLLLGVVFGKSMRQSNKRGKEMDKPITQRELYILFNLFAIAIALPIAWFFSSYWFLVIVWQVFMVWALYRRRWIFR